MTDCPYAKSDMTPCVLRHGATAWAMNWMDRPICAGCELGPASLMMPDPPNWDEIVEKYYRDHPSAKLFRR